MKPMGLVTKLQKPISIPRVERNFLFRNSSSFGQAGKVALPTAQPLSLSPLSLRLMAADVQNDCFFPPFP